MQCNMSVKIGKQVFFSHQTKGCWLGRGVPTQSAAAHAGPPQALAPPFTPSRVWVQAVRGLPNVACAR